ncbi:MFS general substrate transporter [Daldinia caldariorum]|uniref:MFS general substrate transporter n=1 Tax=Daldinia caldariorum TaxID=326644 RepID=UPI0020083B5E|nr:MFS general substrate transporter [Daldinia caldariorum]KAI1471039.1 MFS general substrate transporter [Daldinia caldariorum]
MQKDTAATAGELDHEASHPRISNVDANAQNPGAEDVRKEKPKRGFRFWAIIFALCTVSLLSAAENTVVVTALPTIAERLHVGQEYVWISNVFFLTSAAVQPLCGQLSNLFGRRHLALSIVAVYIIGSGICGGARNSAMLIAGRAIQGMGSGGINMIIDVIVSDLVPLRQRGNFIAIIIAIYGIGTTLGPFLGGVIVETTSWRWVFYINLPIGGLAFMLLFLFLRVKWDRSTTAYEKIRQVDYIGNGILIASTVSILIALTWADVLFPWRSLHILVPLMVGFGGLVLFVIFEGLPFVAEPVMPLRLFGNRTALIVYVISFLNSAENYWQFFFIPLYFQGVRLSSPSQSGVELLVYSLVGIPGAAIALLMLSKWGRYKIIHIIGSAMFTLGVGLLSIMDQNTSTAGWIWINIVTALGSSMLTNTLLPAFQASLKEEDQAAATASWNFIRSFGNVWGVAIPAAIFNSYTASYAPVVEDLRARALLTSGNSYASATKAFVESFEEPVRQQIRTVFTLSLQKVFLIGVPLSGLVFLAVLFEKEIELRTELKTEFGLEEQETL